MPDDVAARPVELIDLGGSAEELRAALLLRGRHHLRVRASTAADATELIAAGFRPAPEAVNAFVDLPFDERGVSRNLRRSVLEATERWHALELELTLYDVASFGWDRLIEAIYYPIFVPYYYSRGLSPYGAHNLDAFARIARPETFLVVVEQRGRIGGAALLRAVRPDGDLVGVAGPPPDGPWVEGLVYALIPELHAVRRALLAALPDMFVEQDFRWLSFGRDLGWFQPRYSRVVLEKLRWASRLAAHMGPDHLVYHFAEDRLGDAGVALLSGARQGSFALVDIGPAVDAAGGLRAELARLQAAWS